VKLRRIVEMHSDLYGSTSRDLETVKTAVEDALGCRLEPHESTYQGGDYYRADLISGESIVVKKNIDPFDGKPVETKFPRYPILVYVNHTSRSSDIQSAFRGGKIRITLLRHK
jgi:hypothetical protein